MKIVLTMESHNGIFKSLSEGIISSLLLVDHSEFLALLLILGGFYSILTYNLVHDYWSVNIGKF